MGYSEEYPEEQGKRHHTQASQSGDRVHRVTTQFPEVKSEGSLHLNHHPTVQKPDHSAQTLSECQVQQAREYRL
jgi:hypothetical protein